MVYTLIALIVVLVAGYISYQSLKFLWLHDWFLGWVRGIFGLSCLAVAAAIGLIAYDIYSYKQILIDQPIATISFEQIEEQYFDAVVVDAEGKQMRFNMHGDQWQLDARIVKWKGYFSGFDIKPAYRLDRLSGRYYDITKETTAKRSTFSLSLLTSICPFSERLLRPPADTTKLITTKIAIKKVTVLAKNKP